MEIEKDKGRDNILLTIFIVSNEGHEQGIFVRISASEESCGVIHKLNSVIRVKMTFEKM